MVKNKSMLFAIFALVVFALTVVSASSISDRTLGKENAPVTIEMFTDFECPFCSRWHNETFPLIDENYIQEGKVKLVVRHFPLESIHFNAKDSAIAAQCAADQGKFFEYVDFLYTKQDFLTKEYLNSYASELNLDLELFEYCINDPATLDIVNRDIQRANKKNINGTPAFFINGKPFMGAQPYFEFETQINNALLNTSPYSCIDFNKDRVNDEADISKLTDYAFNGVEIPEGTNADLNEDSVVNILDVTVLTNYLVRNGSTPKCAIVEPTFVMNTCGDTNGDNLLDEADLDAINSYAFEGVEIPSNVNADLNNDGVVDVLDVVTMTDHVNIGATAPSCANKPIVTQPSLDTEEENIANNPTITPPQTTENGGGSGSGGSGGYVIVNPSTNNGNNDQETTNTQEQNEDTSLEDIDERLDSLEKKVDENNKTLDKILKILARFFRF